MIMNILRNAKMVFWDFDGVIKESLEVKSKAFELVFCDYSTEVKKRIKNHHLANGGISRYEKIPLYLEWGGETPNELIVKQYADKFSELASSMTIASEWVPGVKEYIVKNHQRQTFVMTSATPQKEIEYILSSLGIYNCFKKIFGTPTKKSFAVKSSLLNYNMSPSEAVYCGDAKTDEDAAKENNVRILIRKTKFNGDITCGKSEDLWSDLK